MSLEWRTPGGYISFGVVSWRKSSSENAGEGGEVFQNGWAVCANTTGVPCHVVGMICFLIEVSHGERGITTPLVLCFSTGLCPTHAPFETPPPPQQTHKITGIPLSPHEHALPVRPHPQPHPLGPRGAEGCCAILHQRGPARQKRKTCGLSGRRTLGAVRCHNAA